MRWAAAPGQPPTPYRAPPPPVKKGGGCFKWLMLLMGGAFLLCCCLTSAVLESANDPLDWKAVVPTTGSASLGLALLPAELPPAEARHYKWRQSLKESGRESFCGRGILQDDFTSARHGVRGLLIHFLVERDHGPERGDRIARQCFPIGV